METRFCEGQSSKGNNSKNINARVTVLTLSGLPRSGKKVWKMKFFPGQGKVREFQF